MFLLLIQTTGLEFVTLIAKNSIMKYSNFQVLSSNIKLSLIFMLLLYIYFSSHIECVNILHFSMRISQFSIFLVRSMRVFSPVVLQILNQWYELKVETLRRHFLGGGLHIILLHK